MQANENELMDKGQQYLISKRLLGNDIYERFIISGK